MGQSYTTSGTRMPDSLQWISSMWANRSWLPLSKPIVIYTILTSFIGPWVDFIFAKIICRANALLPFFGGCYVRNKATV